MSRRGFILLYWNIPHPATSKRKEQLVSSLSLATMDVGGIDFLSRGMPWKAPPEGWLSGKRKKRRLWTLSCVHERERNADIIFIDFDSWVTQLQRTTALQHYNNTKRPECFDGVTKWVQPTQTNTNTYFKTNSTIKGSINWGVLMRNNSVGNANENVHVVGSELINLWGSLDLVWRMQSCIGANIMQECCETAWARKQSLLQLMNKSLFR